MQPSYGITVPEHGMTVSMPELTNNISVPFKAPNHAHCPCLSWACLNPHGSD